MKNLRTLFQNIIHDKTLVFLLSLSVGVFIGTITFNSTLFQASIIQSESTLNGSEVAAIFPDIQNIRDIEITKTSESTFLVDFSGTEGEGDSLHPFAFLVSKEGDTLVGVKEITATNDTVINEAVDVEVQPIQ